MRVALAGGLHIGNLDLREPTFLCEGVISRAGAFWPINHKPLSVGRTSMSREYEFRQNAEAADRGAARAKTDYERAAYERVAAGWRDLIAAAERRRDRP